MASANSWWFFQDILLGHGITRADDQIGLMVALQPALTAKHNGQKTQKNGNQRQPTDYCHLAGLNETIIYIEHRSPICDHSPKVSRDNQVKSTASVWTVVDRFVSNEHER